MNRKNIRNGDHSRDDIMFVERWVGDGSDRETSSKQIFSRNTLLPLINKQKNSTNQTLADRFIQETDI